MLGVPHMVVCVNKMDLVDWDQARYERIKSDYMEFAARLNVHDITFIPISALKGDNVVQRSEHTWWYDGSPLLNHLESVYIGSDENFIDPRFPVQYVIRSQTPENPDFRGYAGTVASGVLRPGDELLVLPSGTTSRIASIVTADGEVAEAFPPMAVVITLADDIAVSRGDVLCRPNNRPTLTSDIEATVCWMDERSPLTVGRSYLVKHGTRTVRATAQSLQYRLDINGLHRDEEADSLGLNEIGRVTFRSTEPLLVDDYTTNRTTGSFIVIDPSTNATVGRRGHPGDRHHARQPERGAPRGAPVTGASASRPWARRAARSCSRGCRARASRPWPPRWRRRSSTAAVPPSCSTATTCATGSTATSASPTATAPRTCAGRARWPACSPSRGSWRSSR